MSGSKGGRPKRHIPAQKIHIHLSEPVYAELQFLLADPSSPELKFRFGALSSLVESLIVDWIQRQKRALREEGALTNSPPDDTIHTSSQE